MKKLLLVTMVAFLPGCAWAAARGRDFGDIFRLEGSIGVGLQANANAGELLHLGVGSSRRWAAGWAYGIPTTEKREEDHLPLSLAMTLINPEVDSLHTLTIGE